VIVERENCGITKVPLHVFSKTFSSRSALQILRHANVSTTTNVYVKTVSADTADAMKSLETMCATTVRPESSEVRELCRSFSGWKSTQHVSTLV
jgi:hypothetical protein